MKISILNLFVACGLALSVAGQSSAAEPGWSPVVVATGAYRQQIKSTPIENRPYRPGHFYGNTVRRRYHRGTAMPTPADIAAPLMAAPQYNAPQYNAPQYNALQYNARKYVVPSYTRPVYPYSNSFYRGY
ncbi:hypothetical protein CA13_09870 [Planctomycetes bacterium CA13]|uniref:Uncharacterized protein n=1 Tax=Novipirellula herctigrandis TaxID=2527986 RepID=A0A5C5YYM4_9BACT|nr:hypothetical protein CA13_09870 [Planctomycetes bacterium CA13]